MKHSASRPKTPSTDTTSGVNEARRASAASLYFLFFSSSTKGWTYYPSVELCLTLTTKFLSIESGISTACTGTSGTTEWYKEHIDVNMNVMSHANIPQQMMETAMM